MNTIDPLPSWRQIKEICNVSERTARRWLSGESIAPSYAVTLVDLTLNGRIMPKSWPHHWRFNYADLLEAETAFQSLSWQQVTWYQYVIESWYESIRTVVELQKSIDYLVDKLPKADVIDLINYRKQIEELVRKSEANVFDILNADIISHGKELIRKHGC